MFKRMVGWIKSVSVYDNYVENIKPSLFFRNKIRYILKQWVPIGRDTPFGRIVFIKGHYKECKSPVIKHDKLSAMDISIGKIVWTHWQES